MFRIILLAATVALSACATPHAVATDAELLAAATAATAADTKDAIRADIHFLADDALQGRRTGAPGYQTAADYVGARMEAIGAKPGAGRQYFQNIDFRSGVRDEDAARFAIILPTGIIEGEHPADFLIGRMLSAPQFSIAAPVIFVGYGVSHPAAGHDDFENLDVAGKIVVTFAGAPKAFNSEEAAHFSSSRLKIKVAGERGAVGFLSIPSMESEERAPWSRMTRNSGQPTFTWLSPNGRTVPTTTELPSAALNAAFAERLFEGSAHGFSALRLSEKDSKPLPKFELAAKVELEGATKFETASSPNVVALIEGSDPRLRKEVVVLTAHLDHVGVDEQAGDGEDAINNGTLDNAIGVAIMLDVAERLVAAQPRRSVAVIAVAAEEQGLLGADYFARHPTLGARRIVANVNLDMPLMVYDFRDVIAFGAERTTLGEAVKSEAEAMGLALSPDPFPEQGVFTRSDHYAFVQQGVPAVFLFPGFANGGDKVFADFMAHRYHKPGDDLSQPIDYEAAARFAELNFRIARRIADADEAPSWKDGDFFGALFGKKQ